MKGLFRKYVPNCMTKHDFERLTIKYTIHSCHSREDAEDLTQETFLKLWRCRHVFATDEDVKRWLIRVAVNAGKNLLRHWGKKEMVPLTELYQEPSFVQNDFLYLHQALEHLALKYRQVLYLYYFEEYPVREIAAILHRSETAIQTQLMRARQKLKKELGDLS